jgi:hypothetical protein
MPFIFSICSMLMTVSPLKHSEEKRKIPHYYSQAKSGGGAIRIEFCLVNPEHKKSPPQGGLQDMIQMAKEESQ